MRFAGSAAKKRLIGREYSGRKARAKSRRVQRQQNCMAIALEAVSCIGMPPIQQFRRNRNGETVRACLRFRNPPILLAQRRLHRHAMSRSRALPRIAWDWTAAR
jgi:hypothetical protein